MFCLHQAYITAPNFCEMNEGDKTRKLTSIPPPSARSRELARSEFKSHTWPIWVTLGKPFLWVGRDTQPIFIEWMNVLYLLTVSLRKGHQQPFLPGEKPKPREVKRLAQGHTADKWPSKVSNTDLTDPKVIAHLPVILWHVSSSHPPWHFPQVIYVFVYCLVI